MDGSRMTRLSAAAAVTAALVSACGAGVAAGPTSTVAQPPAAAAAATQPPGSSAGPASAVATSRPPLEATALFDIPDTAGAIHIAAGDGAIWVGGDQVLWRIDPDDGSMTAIDAPIDVDGLTGMVVVDGDLFAADVHSAQVLRIDTATGEVIARIFAPNPTGGALANGALWFGDEVAGGLTRIDLETNVATTGVRGLQAAMVDGTTVWYTTWSAEAGSAIVHDDLLTGARYSATPIPDGTGCYLTLDGASQVWSSCTTPDATHIAVISTAKPGDYARRLDTRPLYGGLTHVGTDTWGLAGPWQDHPGAFLLLDASGSGRSGQLELPDGVDPDVAVVAFGSVWVPSESDRKVYRFPLEAFR